MALVAVLGVLAPAARAASPTACPIALDTCEDAPCAVAAARCALADGDPARAVAVTRAALIAWPDSGGLHVMAAAAYLAADNPMWALRTLLRRLSAAPDDCAVATWLAWTRLRLDQPEGAADLVADPRCAGPDAAGTRALLVRALAHHKAGDADKAAAELDRARRQPVVDASDAPALAAVSRAAEPDRVRNITWRLEAAAGYSTNPLLGAPNDPAVAAATEGSALLQLDAWVRFVPDLGLAVRPLLELQPRVSRLLAAGAAGLSTLVASGRAGILLGRGLPRATLAYRPDFVLLQQGDGYDAGPLWYYGAHRAELEVELSRSLVLFAGAGHRAFRELGRGRWEADLGAGGGAALTSRAALLWAVTTRAYVANDKGYDLLGATAVFSVDARLPATLWARANGGVGVDAYPRSAGAFGIAGVRRDVAVRTGLQVGAAAEPGLRVGLGWDMTWRDSTVPEFAATDHRFTLRVSWSADADVAGPDPVDGALLVPLGWGLGPGEGGAAERVQDLLRRDEQVRPGCGCGL